MLMGSKYLELISSIRIMNNNKKNHDDNCNNQQQSVDESSWTKAINYAESWETEYDAKNMNSVQ
jgi:hypothetical protein